MIRRRKRSVMREILRRRRIEILGAMLASKRFVTECWLLLCVEVI